MSRLDPGESKLKWLTEIRTAVVGVFGIIAVCLGWSIWALVQNPLDYQTWVILIAIFIAAEVVQGLIWVAYELIQIAIDRGQLENTEYKSKLFMTNLKSGYSKILQALAEEEEKIGNGGMDELKEYLNLHDCNCPENDKKESVSVSMDPKTGAYDLSLDSTDDSV